MSNPAGALCEAGTTYSSRAPEFNPVFGGVGFAHLCSFLCCAQCCMCLLSSQ